MPLYRHQPPPLPSSLLVGAPSISAFGTSSGSAYLFDAATGDLLSTLTAPDSDDVDQFGQSVAIDDGIALVGASGNSGLNNDSAYLFDVATGNLLSQLAAPDSTTSLFGWSVAIDDGIALVGDFADSDNVFGSGSAYLFDVATGDFLSKLTAPDATDSAGLGRSVAIDDGIALVGAYGDNFERGAAYLFDVATGDFLSKLTAPDGAEFDEFGWSVAIDDGTALVGVGNLDSSSAYLFDVATGNFLSQLMAPDSTASGFGFGWSVAIDDGIAFVGALGDDNGGSAYLFDASTGDFLSTLTAPDGTGSELFGGAVALDNGTALVGAWGDDDNGSGSGSAYLFAQQPTASTPEPASLLALLAVAGGLAAVRRRSRWG